MKSRTTIAASAQNQALRWVSLFFAIAPAAFGQHTIRVPADSPTIQSGIDAASPGDTVLVSPNTYVENIDFHGKAITVRSSAGPSNTILDGGARGPVVSFTSGETRTSTLSGFTIQNGSGPSQTLGHTSPPDRALPRGLASGPTPSGGIFVFSSAPTILNNTITTNRCNGIYSVQSSPLIQSNHITLTTWASAINGLTPQCGPDQGTGISLTGAYTAASGQPPIVPTILGNTVDNNDLAAVATGGGITLNSAPGTLIQSNLIRGNSGSNATGALSALASPNLLILQNVITQNTVSQGALTVELSGHNGSPATFILNNTIAGDLPLDPTSPIAEIVTYGAGSENLLANNIVVAASTKAAWFCDPAFAFSGQTPVVADHNDLQNTLGPPIAGACADPTGTFGNISADPRFSNAATGDLHLLQGSPAIDSGNNSALALLAAAFTLVTDFSSQPRLQDATARGYTVVDMGAYEAAGAQTSTATTVTLSPDNFAPIGGASATLTAALFSAAGIPTGSVSFSEDNTALGTGTLNPAGAATVTTPALIPGPHIFSATYPGQSPFAPAVSVPVYLLVDRYPVTLSGTSSPNPAVVNQPVTFTFTIHSADNTVPPYIDLTLADGVSHDTLTPDPNTGLATYTQIYSTSYPGDTTHGPANASVSATVTNWNATSTTVTTSANPSLAGQPVTFAATVLSQNPSAPGTPAGSIVFSENGAVLLSAPLIGASATYTTTSLAIGSHNIKAAFVPTNSFTRSFGSITQQITGEPTSTALTASPQSTPSGQTVYLTATVTNITNTPTGSVTFLDSATTLSTQPLANGIARFATSTLAVGAHTLTASYTPVGNFASSSGTSSETITALPSTTTTLIATPNPATIDSPVSFTAHVTAASGNLIGTVSFSDGAELLAIQRVDSSGTAVYQTAPFSLSVGSHLITAAYTPIGPFLASAAQLTENITGTPTSLALTSAANPALVTAPVTLTATLTASVVPNTPLSGTITFLDGSNVLATVPVNSSGTVTFTTSSLTVGQHALDATYSGDSVHASSASSTLPETIQLLPTALSLHLPPTPVTAFSTVPITATLTTVGATIAQACRPSCQILFTANGSLLGASPADATGSATLTATLFPVGAYTITATLAQTANLLPSTASATLTVTPAPTEIHLSAAPNPAIQFQLLTIAAAVTAPGSSASPTGQIAFQDGNTPLSVSPIATVGSAQAASFSTSALSPGTHLITAVYPATPNFLPATASISVTVLPQDFTLSANPTVSIPTEHHTQLTLNLTSIGAFADQIDLACGTLPLYASCVFNGPVSLTPDAKLSVAVHLDTDAVFDYARLHPTPRPHIRPNPTQTALKLAAALPLGLFFARRRKRHRLLKFNLLALITLATLNLTGCSGKYPGHTAPGAYTFLVIATGRTSGITHTTPITLTVTE